VGSLGKPIKGKKYLILGLYLILKYELLGENMSYVLLKIFG